MAFLVTLQNNNTTRPIPLSGDVPETPRTLTSEDFISNAINIVKISTQRGDFDLIDEPLKALIAEYPTGMMSSKTCHELVQQIKGSRLFAEDLPTIYRHLILDLRVKTIPDDFIPSDFSTYNEEFRIACAKLAAQNNPGDLCKNIQKYGITSQDALVEIAMLALPQNCMALSLYILKFGITSQDALAKIAKLAAEQDGWGVSEYIQNYGITSQDDLIEIAKLAAKQNGSALSENIKNYRITRQDALVEIAKLAAAEKNGFGGVSEYIQNYGITSQDALAEIAKIAAAQKNGWAISQYIKNYCITRQDVLVEIAKFAAQQNGALVSMYIQNYDITNQDELVEIAKLAAKQDGRGLSEHIQNYGITDKDVLVEIAKLAAHQDGTGVSKYIHRYAIKSQDALVEIAKLAVEQDVVGVYGAGVSIYISNYGITSQDALVEIAKLAAQKDGRGVSANIQNYKITSQDALLEVAKLAARQDGRGVCEYIRKYDITSEDALVEVAKLAAEQNGRAVSEYIRKYYITSQDALVEIAKLAAKQNGWGVSQFIQQYGITSQAARVEIAKLAVQQDAAGATEYIQNYGITSQDALLEIAILAIRQGNLSVFSFLNNYSLNQNNRAILIARFVNTRPEIMQKMDTLFPKKDHTTALEQYPELRIFGINDDPVSEFNFLFEIDKVPTFLSEKRKDLYQEIIQEKDPGIKALKTNMLRAFCSILDFSDGSLSLLNKFSPLFDSIEQEKNPHIQEQKLSLIAALLMHCRAINVDKTALDEQFSVLKEVFDLQDPLLRTYLSHLFVENLSNPVLCDFIKKNLSSMPQKKKTCAAANLALVLLAPLITKVLPYFELHFVAKKKDVNLDYEIRDVSFIQRMQELLNNNYFQKDHIKTKSLLRSLHTLVDAPQLSNTQKTSILRDLIFTRDLILIKGKHSFIPQYCEQLLRSAEIVALMIDCNQLDCSTSITPEQLPDQIPKAFANVLNIDIPDCNKRVLDTFATWRKPGALLTYAGKLQSLPVTEREKVLPFLKKYAESVLNGTFASSRYDTSASNASEHWLKIHEKAPALIEEWKKGSHEATGIFDVVDTDDPCDLLLSGAEVGSCQNVSGDPRYSKCLAAYLMDPKIRMIAVKNKNGVTVARCMMRLLWDKKAKKFVLFQEKKYPHGCSSFFAEILDRTCKKRAEKLGVPLLVKDESAQGSDVTTLQAFKGKAPFEYVDAHDMDHFQTDAGYEIGPCKYIYRPENF